MKDISAVGIAAILGALCLQTSNSLPHIRVPECPEETGEKILLPKPENCSEFYQCAFGHAFTHACYPGLFYCAEKQYCDYAYNCDYSNCSMDNLLKQTHHTEIQLTTNKPNTCPTTSNPNVTVLLPNPLNCSSFFQCDNGKPVEMSCPSHLYFCPQLSSCEYAGNPNCTYSCKAPTRRIQTVASNTCPAVSNPNVTVLLPNPQNCSSFFECDNGKPVEIGCPSHLYFCPELSSCEYAGNPNCTYSCKAPTRRIQTVVSNSCPAVSNPNVTVFLPNPLNCSSFFECDNGKPVEMSCPGHLYFCPELSSCEYAGNPNCTYSCKAPTRRIQTVVSNSCPAVSNPNVTVFLPNPLNCSSFFECDNGKPVEMSCPGHLYFCPELSSCEYAGNPNCTYSCKAPTRRIQTFASNSCPAVSNPNVTVFLPNPQNCSSFFECDNGKPVEIGCPSHLYFCPELSSCEYAGNPNCTYSCKAPTRRIQTVVSNSCPAVSNPNVTVFLPNPLNCSSFFECDNGKPVEMSCPGHLYFCPELSSCEYAGNPNCTYSCKAPTRRIQTFASNSCPAVSNPNVTVFLPNPQNCSSFFECDNGKPVEIGCPSHLYFCPELSSCEYAGNPNCTYSCKAPTRRIQTVVSNSCPAVSNPNVTVFLLNPLNCSSFFECDNGKPVEMSCPGHLYFCPELSSCEYAGNPNCTYSCKAPTRRIQTVVSNSCPAVSNPNVTVFLPNPQNCSSFFECDNGKPVEIGCPSHLYFCPELSSCEYAGNPNCTYSCKAPTRRIQTVVSNSCLAVSNPNVTVFLPNPLNCSSFFECDNGKPVEMSCPGHLYFCPQLSSCEYAGNPNCTYSCKVPTRRIQTFASNSCPAVSNPNVTVFLPNPLNCSRFFECDNGKPVEMSCPSHLYFCPQLSSCQYAGNPNCTYSCKAPTRRIKTASSHCCPAVSNPNVTILLPNPLDCSSFFECAHGKPVRMVCPSGLYFCPQLSSCEYACNSNCIFQCNSSLYNKTKQLIFPIKKKSLYPLFPTGILNVFN